MKEVRVDFDPRLLAGDICARSGLYKVGAFVGLYCTDLNLVGGFYKDLFGWDSVEFEADDVLSLVLDQIEVFLQRVDGDSAFAELVGSQTIGLTITQDEYRRLSGRIPEGDCLTLETVSGGPAVREGFSLVDPEGNRLLLTPVRANLPA